MCDEKESGGGAAATATCSMASGERGASAAAGVEETPPPFWLPPLDVNRVAASSRSSEEGVVGVCGDGGGRHQ